MKAGGNTARASGWPGDLLGPVSQLPEYSRLWVAFSGGLDSTLLLQAASACHPSVTALHINHQLQPNHQQTEQFCRDVCEQLGVELSVARVDVPVGARGAGGLEDAARTARYEVFHNTLNPGDMLLMAHHADDQAETVLFRLLRGSGVSGLAGMPKTRPLGKGTLYRPWLGVSRDRLEQVATKLGVRWVEDPSNQSRQFDRNYLRHSVLPGLKDRWPGLLKRVAHSARSCAESDQLNQRLAELQWQTCSDGGRLAIEPFSALSVLERRNLVRWWIQSEGFPPPAFAGWDQVLAELLEAGEDREPELRGDGFSLRRYRGHIYLVPDNPPAPEPVALTPGSPVRWPGWLLSLEAVAPAEQQTTPPPIRVSTRQGGERVRLAPGKPSRALKTWLQEQSVPPWERSVLPLVWRQTSEGEELIGIGDLWCSEQYSGGAPATGWRLIVERDCD